MISSSTTTLLFESGIMKISDYDPVHDRYLTRTLQLPSFPLFSNLDLPFSEPTPKLKTSLEKVTVNNDKKTQTTTMSRFIEYFELADKTTTPPSSGYYNASSSTLRSSRSTSSKKTTNSLFSTKAPRRCYSNPNLSKKSTIMMIEPFEPKLHNVTLSSSRKAPKRSLSNAFHVLSGLLPTKSKRRLNKHDNQTKEDGLSRLSTSSSSSTIRMAWQGTTWLDEMKTSSDFGPRQRLASIDQTRPWWTTTTAPLSSYNVCVNA